MSSNPTRRVAIVTGASRGIGKAIALRLAKDGFDVSVNDLPSQRSGLEEVSESIKRAGCRALMGTGDVSKEKDVMALVADTAEKLGSVDVMVANAGYCLIKPFHETSAEEWDSIFSVNARGTFFAYKHAASHMIKQGRGGRIIGVCSVVGKKGEEMLAAYSATKFAVHGLTHAAAQELAQYGITVNAYAPGPIDTAMCRPDEVAGLVSYFASQESEFMTGQIVAIDGGRVYD
ncbi:NAD(P)-binding protein [Agrocybe pediades]|nr:NAD(P)-binding protein [Agrocybe pediades]